jgi:carbon starvation protein
MTISLIVLISIAVLAAGYILFGRFLRRQFGPDDSRPTPAWEFKDGVDFVPAKMPLLLGQHLSAIAAAGPIVGPILAGLMFGWLPALLWILLGSIFIGGVHDYASLVASIRNKAASIAFLVQSHLSPTAYRLFLVFMWLSLLYVVVAFTDITAQTFHATADTFASGPAVASSSILYLILAVVMGVMLYKFKLPLSLSTAIILPLVLLAVWIGPRLPQSILAPLAKLTVAQWDIFLLAYCFVASLIPMWLLLQPRGYLGGWLLYLTIIAGLVGSLFGGYTVQYPAVLLDGWASSVNGKLIYPFLFITIACGACSGFHAIVCSGTTSKQLNKQKDALPIGYGAMLLEALVAVVALGTLMILPRGSEGLKSDPNVIYADGIAKYLQILKIDYRVAFPFALLAFSTFVYDTLDVATRLARYIFQEITGWKSTVGAFGATLVSVLLPLAFLMTAEEKAYLVAWPIFGTSNQMLASLSLLAISIWLIRTGRRAWFAIWPMVFMLVMTVTALVLQVKPLAMHWIDRSQTPVKQDVMTSGICGIVLLILCVTLVVETVLTLLRRGGKKV